MYIHSSLKKCSSKTYPACSPWERQGISFEAESDAGSYFEDWLGESDGLGFPTFLKQQLDI